MIVINASSFHPKHSCLALVAQCSKSCEDVFRHAEREIVNHYHPVSRGLTPSARQCFIYWKLDIQRGICQRTFDDSLLPAGVNCKEPEVMDWVWKRREGKCFVSRSVGYRCCQRALLC